MGKLFKHNERKIILLNGQLQTHLCVDSAFFWMFTTVTTSYFHLARARAHTHTHTHTHTQFDDDAEVMMGRERREGRKDLVFLCISTAQFSIFTPPLVLIIGVLCVK